MKRMSGAHPGPTPDARGGWFEDVPDAVPPGAQVVTSDSVVLPPEPQNVRAARRWVATRIPPWGDDLTDTIVLLTSELVTNVVVHARTELVLGLAVTERDLVIGVRDLDLGRQELAGPERHGGRGLTLVSELAGASGKHRHAGGGKTYWFRVSR
jgi:hypothetical protein